MGRGHRSFIFINGPYCSGKDTQALRLAAGRSTVMAISPGGLLREAKKSDNPYHLHLEPYQKIVQEGGLVPARAIMDVMSAVIDDGLREGKDTFIITGFTMPLIRQLMAEGR